MAKIFVDIALTVVAFLLLLITFSSIVHLYVRVPYVPTSRRATNLMVKLAHLKKGEIVYDLGCGDGRLLFAAEALAAKHRTSIQATGFEAAPFPYLLAKAKKWLLGSTIQLKFQNFFHENFRKADVIFCYLGPEVMTKLFYKLKKECRKGTRIYSNTFRIQGLEPTKIWPKNRQEHLPSIYLYQI